MPRIFVLRKVKSFNKSRYSRNRQTTRVAFFLSLGINVLVILGIFSLHYAFFIKLSTLWWLFLGFLASFVFGAFLRATAATTTKNFLRVAIHVVNNSYKYAMFCLGTLCSKLSYSIEFFVSSQIKNVHGYDRMAELAAWSKAGWYAQDYYWRLKARFSCAEKDWLYQNLYPKSRRTFLARWLFITYENAVPRDF